MQRPDLGRVPEFYHNYINHVIENDLMNAFKNQTPVVMGFLASIPDDKIDHAYAEGKWTIKDTLVHLSDCERVLIYRAMRIARGDKTELPGFDEKLLSLNANANSRKIAGILNELKLARTASIAFIETLNEEELNRTGTANGFPLSARLLVNHIYGHHQHHLNILKERYF